MLVRIVISVYFQPNPKNRFIVWVSCQNVPIDVSALVKNHQKSALTARCPKCDNEFNLSKSLLFDGMAEFPANAEQKRQELLQELKERASQILEREKNATTGSEQKAIAVGIGKIIEKILSAHKNFELVPSDCRFLAEQIDMVAFDGVSMSHPIERA